MNLTPELAMMLGTFLILVGLSYFAFNSVLLAIYHRNPEKYKNIIDTPSLQKEYNRKYRKGF